MNSKDGVGTTAATMTVVVLGGLLSAPGRAPVRVTSQGITIGRNPQCSIVLDDNEVSTLHCEVRAEPHGVLLRDLGSRNGTLVGGVRIREGILTAPCTIQLGRSQVKFEPLGREHVEVAAETTFGDVVARSPKMLQVLDALRRVAPKELSILITGETGTGKEAVANAVHKTSRRSKGPFVVVDCTTISASLAESHLFGHERGAFTGATQRQNGAFHEADGGTIFLDELGDLPPELQPKLLRALAERQVRRVGSTAYERVDVRVVAATRRDLVRSVNSGGFRSDLFFRIAQAMIELPPLRDRREDIPLLVEVAYQSTDPRDRVRDLDEVLELVTSRLAQHDWPGNVRQLIGVVQLAAVVPGPPDSLLGLLPREGGREALWTPSPFAREKQASNMAFEEKYFRNLIDVTGGNISEMARLSGMERCHVRSFLRKYDLYGDVSRPSEKAPPPSSSR
jgi:DNA-binding NtrC family response regulator